MGLASELGSGSRVLPAGTSVLQPPAMERDQEKISSCKRSLLIGVAAE